MDNLLISKIETLDDSGLEIFIGPAGAGFTLLGKEFRYVTFSNGCKVNETEVCNYMGPEIKEEDLIELTAKMILAEAKCLESRTLIFRDESISKFSKYESFIDSQGGYHPAGVHYISRVVLL